MDIFTTFTHHDKDLDFESQRFCRHTADWIKLRIHCVQIALAGAVSRLPLLRADPPAARGGEGGLADGGEALAVREGDHAADRDRWLEEVAERTGQ